jgi:hypothetical protein
MTIRELTLREMIIERILFAVDEDILEEMYHTTEDELQHMSDHDLIDLYEDVVFDTGHASGLMDADDER